MTKRCNVLPYADEWLRLAQRAAELDISIVEAAPEDRYGLETELRAVDARLPLIDEEGSKRLASAPKSAAFQIGVVRRVLEMLESSDMSAEMRKAIFARAFRSLDSVSKYVTNLSDPAERKPRRARARA